MQIHSSIRLLWVLLSVVVLFGGTACQKIKTSENQTQNPLITELAQRKSIAGNEQEWEKMQALFKKLSEAINKNPEDNAAKIKLTELYLTEVRITGNSMYYGAALKVIDNISQDSKASQEHVFLAKSYKSSILLSLHRFSEAKAVAEEARAINDFDSGIYGALVDASVELGNYEEAVKACDKMLAIHPDLRSYSRSSYIRQIYGDNPGAIAAIKLAIQAGPAGSESTEWARVILGDLYLNMGKNDTARMLYETSLQYRPNYASAEIGLAKVGRAERKYDDAIMHCKNAIRSLSESSYVAFLADLYELKGEKDKAKEVREDVLRLLLESEADNEKEGYAKHNGSREIATALMAAGKLDEALKNAQIDLALRPENIDANELIAWIYYLKGDYANAKVCADKMMRMNTQNANLIYKAGMIYEAGGDTAKGKSLKAQAQSINKTIDPLILTAQKV
ncbi:MAG: tetratricopeptide repeat protein [Bacteroidia bacterium]|nr:tetratricopeptide repeat protein [Bacteroidia bacterium]